MTQIDNGRSATSPYQSLSGRGSDETRASRIRVRGLKVSKSALRRGSSAIAGTALAAGLVVGGSGAAQAHANRPVLPAPAVQPGATTGHGVALRRRLHDVRQDLDRAVAAGDVTREQADAFVAKLVRHMV